MVFSVIVAEAATIAAIGALLGFLVYGVILAAATALLRQRTGVVLDVFAPHPVLWIAPLGMLLLGAVAGLLPAWKAYATDVADNLAPAT
jgi:putative ABC transport system permease protein